MGADEFWQTPQPQWRAYCEEHLETLKFLDMEMASIRHLLYTTSKPDTAPARSMTSFLFFGQDEEQTAEEIGDQLMNQMIGIMNL